MARELAPVTTSQPPNIPLICCDLLWILISSAPSTTLAERRLESVGNPASSRVTHGFKPAFGHAEPRRGTEWWGKSPLVTLGLFV